jgi:hypothetical protein
MSYSANGTPNDPKLLVSMTSTPTSRYSACNWRISSGRVTVSSSLHPSRFSPPKSSGVSPSSWIPVPMAPSKITTRWRVAARKSWETEGMDKGYRWCVWANHSQAVANACAFDPDPTCRCR